MGAGSTFKQRTDWAEYVVAQLAGQPLISECVYHSPQCIDKTQKEVVDILLALKGRAILLSSKCQQVPGSRSPDKETSWVEKAAKGAAGQIRGAIRTIRDSSYWCEHPRRGRVQFGAGELCPTHSVVLVEALNPVCLGVDLPLYLEGVPISYFSVSDFCNILVELRTIPEIEVYLDARRSLPLDALRVVGQERSLYEYYLLNDESFSGCLGPHDAGLVSAARALELKGVLARKAEVDKYAGLIERVADCLAERDPKYMSGLPDDFQLQFDSSAERKAYLQMQAELCDLRLADRAQLGRHFAGLIERANYAEPPTMAYASAWVDGKPDLLYVLVSGRGKPRSELLGGGGNLLLGAMAFYNKRRGMAIIDRDSVGFEVFLIEVPSHSIAAYHFGELHFGNLHVEDVPATLVPEARQV